jgi:hypothetical protein
MWGFGREPDIIALNDTAPLRAYLYNDQDQPFVADDLQGVTFTIQKPDGLQDTLIGSIDDDGSGQVNYQNTDLVGEYTVVATFKTVEGVNKSTRADFEVIDPFNPPDPTEEQLLGELVWRKLEDLFDAEDEGPWLRDMTLNFFNREKIPEFVNDALFEINNANPPTDVNLDSFFHLSQVTADSPLLVQGVYLQVLRHLIRSYTEQPNPTGAPFGYLDRRDYAQRWMAVYQMEADVFKRWLALWKRKFLALGHSKVLVSSKAGRLLPAPMRTRNVGRGYW